MVVGVSSGQHYEDEFHMMTAPTFPQGADKEMEWSPSEEQTPKDDGTVVSPQGMRQNQQLDDAEQNQYGPGIPIGYKEWKEKYAPNDSGQDYDLQGAYEAGVVPDARGHMPDTWKLPNHPTFSDESMYAKDNPDLAGHWYGETFTPPALK